MRKRILAYSRLYDDQLTQRTVDNLLLVFRDEHPINLVNDLGWRPA